MDQVLSFVSFVALYGVSYGIVLFLISIGLVLTMGLMRIVNLAHGSFAAAGGYLCAYLINAHGLPYGFAVLAAVLIIAALSIPIERLFYADLYGASELNQVLMTIGLMLATVATITLIFGPNIYPSKLPTFLSQNVDLGFRTIQVYRLFVIVLGVLLLVTLWYIFERTNFGAYVRASVDNPSMAEATGINVKLVFSTTFALGSGLAALGGAIGFAMLPLEPLYPFKYLTLVLIVVVLSGVGNIRSSAAVAVLIGVIDTAGRFVAPSYGAFFIYIILICVLTFRAYPAFSGRFR